MKRIVITVVPIPRFCEDQELLLWMHGLSRFHALPEYLLTYRLRNRISFAKAWRTRRTFYEIQRQYFAKKEDCWHAGVARTSFCLRVAKDAWTIVSQVPLFWGRKASRCTNVSKSSSDMWQQILEDFNGLHVNDGWKGA